MIFVLIIVCVFVGLGYLAYSLSEIEHRRESFGRELSPEEKEARRQRREAYRAKEQRREARRLARQRLMREFDSCLLPALALLVIVGCLVSFVATLLHH